MNAFQKHLFALLLLTLSLCCASSAEAATIVPAMGPVIEQAKSFFYTFSYLLSIGCFIFAVFCLFSGRYPEFVTAFIALLLFAGGPTFIAWVFTLAN